MKLKFPLEVIRDGKKVTITTIEISRFKAKFLKFVPKGLASGEYEYADLFPLIAAMSGLSVEEIGELDAVDFMAIAKEITPNLNPRKSRKTGKM